MPSVSASSSHIGGYTVLTARRGRRFHNGASLEVEDALAEELEIEIVIEGYESRVFATSPHMLYELALGYAYSEGLDVSEAKVSAINLHNNRKRIVVKDVRLLERPRPLGERVIEASKLLELYRTITSKTMFFQLTGCFHFAGLDSVKGELVIVEDISRYCAFYKAIGRLLLEGRDPGRYIAVLSSRANRKFVTNIANCGIAIAAFRGASTASAVDEAQRRGVTLIAYLRDDRFTVYTHTQRVLPSR